MLIEFVLGLALCLLIYLLVSPIYFLPESPSVRLDSHVVSQSKIKDRDRGADQVEFPMQLFEGQDWHTSATKSIKTLASNKYGQFQVHSVLTEQGTIADNWLWTNDRDQVNVIALLKDGQSIIVSKESRYGLWNASISALNGYIRINESSVLAVNRVLRRHGVVATELQQLGKYRVQVNRGGGFLHIFLAKECSLRSLRFEKSSSIQSLRVSRAELIHLLSAGAVLEAQWVASLALALISVDAAPSPH